ncbi:MAG: hypothetical protein FJY56_21185 [Betaproteobacteria bacterium]|nr:hypothetical protein [Betaproteobacteria bacterium]
MTGIFKKEAHNEICNPVGAGRTAGRRDGGPRAGLSRQAHALDRTLRAGWRHRHSRAPGRTKNPRALGPCRRGGKPRGRRRQHRRRFCRQGRARRLHTAGGRRAPRHRHEPVSKARLRFGQGSGTDRQSGDVSQHYRGAPVVAGENVKELIALAKARPGELNYGALMGSPNHLAMELLNMLGGVKMTLIPYKGGGQVVSELVAGQVQLASVGFPPGIAMVQAGRLRAIAQTGNKRVSTLRDVPTVAESGIPGYVVTSWYGLFGPAALPRDIVAKWSGEIGNILAAADVKERLATLGAEPAPLAAEEFGRFVREEIGRWAKVVKASGATAN